MADFTSDPQIPKLPFHSSKTFKPLSFQNHIQHIKPVTTIIEDDDHHRQPPLYLRLPPSSSFCNQFDTHSNTQTTHTETKSISNGGILISFRLVSIFLKKKKIRRRRRPIRRHFTTVKVLYMHTINPTKLTSRFLLLNPTRGLPKFSFTKIHKRFRGESLRKMAWNLERCDNIVRPTTEIYVDEAIEALRGGKVIAVPTVTLYDFACDACSVEAVNRMYEIKGRKHTSPLAICVGDVSDIGRFVVMEHLPLGLLDTLFPGPVTLVLTRDESSILEKSLNLGLDSVGVRVPDSDFIRIVARGSGSAMALTSANLSGQPSSVDVKDFKNLWENCTFVYDGGILPAGRAGSTDVDLTMFGKYKILRQGRTYCLEVNSF